MPSSYVELNPYNFESAVYSIDRLICGGVANQLGLLIPEFQRDYTWEIRDIERLISDLLLGFSGRINNSSGHFFGATVWNERKRPNEINFINPSYDVVDGQQRITTCLLLLISFLLKIRETQKQIIDENSLPTDLLNWLANEKNYIEQNVISNLTGNFIHGNYNYPKIIHEEDTRGQTSQQSEYKSPISKILMSFASIDENTFTFDFENISGNLKKDQKNVFDRLKNNIEQFNSYLEDINNKSLFDKFNIPFVENVNLKRPLFIELFNTKPPTSSYDAFLNSNKIFEKQIRLMQFFGFFLKASCFTVIICKNEDAAFSIFDSLNTTGVPLTAIETLKPFVMRDYREANENFNTSEAFKNFEYLEKLIQSSENESDKQSNLSKEIVIHSGLLGGENKILNNNLTTQRIGLRNLHDRCSLNGDKDLSSTILAKVTKFRDDYCSIENIRRINENSSLTTKEEDIVKLTNAFLSKTRTRLYRPLLTRFYWNDTDRKLFYKACKAVTAFYVLRRAASQGTERIDEIFRSCLVGTKPSFEGFELKYREPNSPLTEIDLKNLKTHLQANLKTKNFEFTLLDKEKWINKVKDIDNYDGGQYLCKFMLLVAHDGAKIDPNDNRLIQREDASPDSSTEYLSFSMWDKDIYETIEHVAPQNEKSTGWNEVYTDPKLKNTLGNLVLLPKGNNSALKDSAWPIKKLFLKILLQDSINERKKLVNEGKANGINLPKSIEKSVISRSGYTLVKSHMLDGLQNVSEWDKSFIEKRSVRLYDLVWDKMKNWLE